MLNFVPCVNFLFYFIYSVLCKFLFDFIYIHTNTQGNEKKKKKNTRKGRTNISKLGS